MVGNKKLLRCDMHLLKFNYRFAVYNLFAMMFAMYIVPAAVGQWCCFFFSFETENYCSSIPHSPNSCSIMCVMYRLLRAKQRSTLHYITKLQIMRESPSTLTRSTSAMLMAFLCLKWANFKIWALIRQSQSAISDVCVYCIWLSCLFFLSLFLSRIPCGLVWFGLAIHCFLSF